MSERPPQSSGTPPEHSPRSSAHAGWRSPVAILMMVLATVGVGIPAAIQFTPPVETTIAGQYLGVGARSPSAGWVGDLDDITEDGPTSWLGAAVDGFAGPARLEQIGNTTIDLYRIRVRGPMRPMLELGPLVRTREADGLLDPDSGPAAREQAVSAITDAFVTWAVRASVLLLVISVALIGLLSGVRIWLSMGRASRHHADLTVAEAWGRDRRRLRRDALIALAITTSSWAGTAWMAAQDTREGLVGVSSPRDLVGAAPVTLRPVGPEIDGYTGVVIGDSRAARLGGPLGADPSAVEEACSRSTDSLAAQLTQLSAEDRYLNLACSSATITEGLLGPQDTGAVAVPAQMARTLQVAGLRHVVVVIGPNDLAWADFLRYCYGVEECDDAFTSAQFDYRLARFDRDYGDLLAALAALPDEPQVTVVGSYDVFDADASCPATQGPAGVPGLDADGIGLLRERTARFNDVLSAGAEAYDFDVAIPRLETLCRPADPEVGGDLQSFDDPAPFHPTGVGMVRLGAAVYAAIRASDAGVEEGAVARGR